MYCDDTVLFADTKQQLQKLLNTYIEYCKENQLFINTSKTKVMIFGAQYRKPNIFVNGVALNVVNKFKYLGIVFSKNGRFINSIKGNIEKARKAFLVLLGKVDKSTSQ